MAIFNLATLTLVCQIAKIFSTPNIHPLYGVMSPLPPVGAFEDSEVTHVEGEVNPVRDLDIISEELRLKDVQYVSKQIVSISIR